MTTIFDSTRQVKSGGFGRGILRSTPVDRLDMTEACRRWWAAASNGPSELDRLADEMAAERAALDAMERGVAVYA
jgi:hypothetical protein